MPESKNSTKAINAPKLESLLTVSTRWGQIIEDEYSWIRRSDQAVSHLTLENEYTTQQIKPTEELQETIFNEIKSRVKETDLSVPVHKDGWSYYSRTVEGLSYPIHCRKLLSEKDPEEQILLDENVEAEQSEYFSLGIFDVSPNHEYLLWGADTVGNEKFNLKLRDLNTGEDADLGVSEVSATSCWSTDNEHYFYVRTDEMSRPAEVYLQNAKNPFDLEKLIYKEEDERFFVGIAREKDDSFIQIGSSSKISDEVSLIPAGSPLSEPVLVKKRKDNFEYSLSHHKDKFIIVTNADGADNFKICTTSDENFGYNNWQDLLPHDQNVMISGVEVSSSKLILQERNGGYTRLRLMDWDTQEIIEIPKDQQASTIWVGANPDYFSTKLRYGYSSLTSPTGVYEYNFETGDSETLKIQEVLGGFEASVYDSKVEWATAADGTEIPVSLVWKNDVELEQRPTLVYAYGAYEICLDPSFSVAALSLLDRGYVYALVHARGGGEMGRHWYEQGKLENKMNTFTDVISATKHLVNSKISDPERICLRGGSAGGLIVGVCINHEPELYKSVVAEVPFVDVVATMLDTDLALTVTEWEEWGDPGSDQNAHELMSSYCPYDNVAEKNYPKMLVTTGINDPWVGFWEPTKWVQRLRENSTSGNEILLWAELAAGHGGPSGRYDSWKEEARNLAYIIWSLS